MFYFLKISKILMYIFWVFFRFSHFFQVFQISSFYKWSCLASAHIYSMYTSIYRMTIVLVPALALDSGLTHAPATRTNTHYTHTPEHNHHSFELVTRGVNTLPLLDADEISITNHKCHASSNRAMYVCQSLAMLSQQMRNEFVQWALFSNILYVSAWELWKIDQSQVNNIVWWIYDTALIVTLHMAIVLMR